MDHLSVRGNKTGLKTVHCISSCGWIGGGLAVLILLKLAGAPAGQQEAAAFQRAILAIDDFLIIPSAGVATLSGLLLCSGKPGGITDHRWILEKCIITAILLLFGTFWLAPDLRALLPAGTEAPQYDLSYHRHWVQSSAAAIFQTVGLLLLVVLSVLKPEKDRSSHPHRQLVKATHLQHGRR